MLVINKAHAHYGTTWKHFVFPFGFGAMVPSGQLAVFLRIRQAKETERINVQCLSRKFLKVGL